MSASAVSSGMPKLSSDSISQPSASHMSNQAGEVHIASRTSTCSSTSWSDRSVSIVATSPFFGSNFFQSFVGATTNLVNLHLHIGRIGITPLPLEISFVLPGHFLQVCFNVVESGLNLS